MQLHSLKAECAVDHMFLVTMCNALHEAMPCMQACPGLYLEKAPDRSLKGNVAVGLQGCAIQLVSSRDLLLRLKEGCLGLQQWQDAFILGLQVIDSQPPRCPAGNSASVRKLETTLM